MQRESLENNIIVDVRVIFVVFILEMKKVASEEKEGVREGETQDEVYPDSPTGGGESGGGGGKDI